MKTMKKLAALTLAFVMAMALAIPTMAAGSTPSGGLTLDSSITVAGLSAGDSVKFYKILKWDNGWVAEEGFTSLSDGQLTKIKAGQIDSAMAGDLGELAASATAKYNVAESDGSAVQASPEAGLYIAIITPAAGANYMYNPVFVAADYQQATNPNSDSSYWTVTTLPSYSDNALAKKAEVTLDKVASDGKSNDLNWSETVAAGDTVTFTVTTTIPGFADNYTKPVFKVSDALSEGLALSDGTITLVAPANLEKGADKDYTVTASDGGFVLAFTAKYLKTVKTPTDVTITYKAVVTSEAPYNVNQEENTVTVNFSNAPDDEEGHGVLHDKTNHYTFSIDANLLGSDGYNSTEVVKVGIDKDGNEITKTVELSNGKSVGALEGAVFGLYTNSDGASEHLYTNAVFNGRVTSGSDGRLSIKGLDAGVYWLKEISAPAGYIADANAHKVEIIADIDEVTVSDGDCTYKTNVLNSYTVKIDGKETANYTLTNDGDGTASATNAGDTVVGTAPVAGDNDQPGKIKNKQGVDLPSTGGIGTKIFYAMGAVLVIGAGVVLVSRKRALD